MKYAAGTLISFPSYSPYIPLIGNLNEYLCFEGTDLLPFPVFVHNYTEMSLSRLDFFGPSSKHANCFIPLVPTIPVLLAIPHSTNGMLMHMHRRTNYHINNYSCPRSMLPSHAAYHPCRVLPHRSTNSRGPDRVRGHINDK